MVQSYHVRLQSAQHTFCAAHFITYQDDVCEPLHGHNYRVAIEVHGPLEKNHYVVDFVDLSNALKKILDQLDHQMLLPTEHPTIQVVERTGPDRSREEIEVTHGLRRWIFPRSDCMLLPMANTTAELLARYIATQLQGPLEQLCGCQPARLQVAVEESDDRWGVYNLES